MRTQLHIEPELIPGSGGVFEVVADGRVLFSKRSLGRFPKDDKEVLDQLRR
jgi:selT/selW/selH-like putative selenoprotein